MAKSPDDLLSDPLLQSAPSLEGFKVLDPAVLYAKVGQGGMGAVYRGRHFSLECDVAVKVLKGDLAQDEAFVLRFEREARLAAQINHQNVVRVMDVKQHNGIHYLVMEFVKGETARERMLRKGPLAEREALAILVGATMGLCEAHSKNIVHRDIKPDNVLVSIEGVVKLADLGLAKAKRSADAQSMTLLSSGVMGTPQYMPPEQWRSPDVKPSADVWALGATLYYLLAGKNAIAAGELLMIADQIRDHDFPNLREVRSDVRPEVAALVAKCTARKPEERFADARALLKALRPLVANDDDDVLLDAASGTGQLREATVTPPPRATLAKIKLRVQSQEFDGTQNWTGPRPRSEQPTIPSPTKESDSRPGVAGNGGDGDAASEATAALVRGLKALPMVGGLDTAIAEFERALQLDAGLAEAKNKLALALSHKAKRLEATDLNAAYDCVARARELGAAEAVWHEVWARVVKELQARLATGLTLEHPKAGLVCTGPSVRLQGSIASSAFTAVRVAIDSRPQASSLPFPLDACEVVQVVAGDFEATLTATGDGIVLVRALVEAEKGLCAEMPPREIVLRMLASESPDWADAVADAGAVTVDGRKYPRIVVEKQSGMRMVLIPPGEFQMGSPDSESDHASDETRHRRVIRKAFYLGETEVTQAQWQKLMGSNPSSFKGTDSPVERVSWNDCQQFVQRLNKLGDAFRLPSEAEWEYACRASALSPFSLSPFSFGANITTAQANFDGNYPYNSVGKGEYRQKTVRVRSLPANAFGLYEMHGNVWEWCEDTYAAYPGTGTEEPTRGEGSRVLRGGSWGTNATNCRSANRHRDDPENQSVYVGFRLARSLS